MSFTLNPIKSNAAIFITFFLILLVWHVFLTRNVSDNERIIQAISLNSQHLGSAVLDLNEKILSIVEKKNEISNVHQEMKLLNENIIHNFPNWDFTQLSNLENFRFTTFNNVCQNEDILVLIFVTTAPDHVKVRQIIRNTWGKKNNNKMRLLFSLGAVQNSKQQSKIQKENLINHDILQGNFIDAYKNLTYKHIMDFKYASYYCPQAKYVMKLDDDFFINIPNVLKFLENSQQKCQEYIFCVYRDNLKVWREHTKWGVDFQEYANSVYPRYCLGNFPIIYPFDAALNLYKDSQKGDFFYIDDAYITGIIAERINLKHIQALGYSLTETETKDLLNDRKKQHRQDFLFSWHTLKPENITKLWSIYKNSNFDYKNSMIC